MKSLFLILPAGLGLLLAACVPANPALKQERGEVASFDDARNVIESSCVHCHGPRLLPGMPSFASTRDLAALSGPDKLIVPGAPEQSRFFQVVTFSDSQVGAMPPTGHALTPREVGVLKAWIAGGAELPEKNVVLEPRGRAPRSR